MRQQTPGSTGLVPALAPPIVRRPRLERLLDRSNARLKLLVAPAGYGKTTVAGQWLEARLHAWYTCRTASSDIAGLANGLADIIIDVMPCLTKSLRTQLLVASQSTHQRIQLIDVVIEHLLSWPRGIILVVDGYHWISQSREAESLFEAIIARTRVPMLITSRTKPDWVSACDRLYGEVFEIDQKTLAMTRAEAAKLLAGKPQAVTRELIALAQGWPAILGLAWHADPHLLPRRDATLPDQLYDYIAQEIYVTASEETRRVLPLLARLETWDSRLLASALGESEANRMIIELQTLGMLLLTEKGQRPTSTLHPLIQTFITTHDASFRLDTRIGISLTMELLRLERWDDAFAIARAVGSHELIQEVIRSGMYPILDAGRLSTLAKWLAPSGPPHPHSPIESLGRAELAHRNGDFVAAETFARQSLANAPTEPWTASRALLVAGRSAHLSHSDQRALDYFTEALAIASDSDIQLQALWGRFVAASALQSQEARSLLTQFEQHSPSDPTQKLRRATAVYSLDRIDGSLTEAINICESTFPLTDQVDNPLVVSAFLHAYGAALAISADYRLSLSVSSRATDYARAYRLRFALCHTLITQAVGKAGLRAYDDSIETLRTALEVAHDRASRIFTELNASAVEARVHLMQGDFERALSVTTPRWPRIPDLAMWAELIGTRALAMAVGHRRSEASVLLRQARTISQTVEVQALALATSAVLSHDLEESHAGTLVSKAFICAAKRSALDAFVVAYRAYPPLLRSLADDVASRPMLYDLMQRAGDGHLVVDIGVLPTHSKRSKPLYSLTRREVELCELVVLGMSNREMADHLILAESTVKIHLQHIYAKLGVRSRTEAALKLTREHILD